MLLDVTTNLEEVVWSSSCDMRLATTWCRIELEAVKEFTLNINNFNLNYFQLTMKTSMNRLIPLMLLDYRNDNSSLVLRKSLRHDAHDTNYILP